MAGADGGILADVGMSGGESTLTTRSNHPLDCFNLPSSFSHRLQHQHLSPRFIRWGLLASLASAAPITLSPYSTSTKASRLAYLYNLSPVIWDPDRSHHPRV